MLRARESPRLFRSSISSSSPSRRANWPRPKPWIGALPMHRCASVDWTFRRSLETASNPPVVCHLYRWIRRPVCVPTRSDSCQSRCIDPLPLSLRFFFHWMDIVIFFDPGSSVSFIPRSFLLVERVRRFETTVKRGEGGKKNVDRFKCSRKWTATMRENRPP